MLKILQRLRTMQSDQRTFYFNEFRLAADAPALFRLDELIALEPLASRVLLYLIENRNRLVTKDELLENVWPDVFTTDDVLKKAISQIRRALTDAAENPRFVQTLHRRGYRFIAEASETPANQQLPINNQSADDGDIQIPVNDDPDFDQLVGRAVETELLQAEFRRTLGGRGQPVLIAGDPGAGKTQLAARFERWAGQKQNAVCLRARFFDYEAARLSSYDLFLGLVNEALAETSSENIHRNQGLRLAIKAQTGIELPAELFAGSTTHTERLNPQSDAFRMIAPLAECFVKISEKRPVVFIFDDLQWADESSLKIIGYLMRTAASARLMIVALARRAEIETPSHPISAWLRAQAVYRSYTALNLKGLTQAEDLELIREIFKHRLDESAIPASDLRLLHRTTGGNPYFLVETVRLLIAENAIEKNPTGAGDSSFLWHWRGLKDVPLPETIRMAAHSKLERFDSQTLDYVERAAVLGDAFHLETLEKMYEGDYVGEAELEKYFRQAIAAQVLTEQAVSGADDCQFYHTTLRRAVYGDLSPRRRKRLHARAAAAIESIYGRDWERVAAALGAHYEAGGNFDLSFECSLKASELAGLRFDWTEAAECAARAVRAAEVLDRNASSRLSDENRLRLLLALGEAFLSTGKRIEAEAELTEAAALAEKIDNHVALAAALGIKAQTQVLLGRYRESLLSSQKALQLSRETGSLSGVANALLQIASAQYTLCEYEAACQSLQTVIDEFGPESYYSAVALGKLGWVHALQGRYRESKSLLNEALAFHRDAGDVRQRTVLALCLDWAEYGAGNYEAAINYASKARDEAYNIGEPYSEAIAIMRIGKSRLAQGFYQESEIIFKTVLAKIAGKNAIHSEAETLWLLGRAKSLNGNRAEAAALFERALATIREIGDREDEFRILIDIARLQTEQRDAALALGTATQAWEIAQEINIPDGIGAALIELSSAHLALNQPRQALQTAERGIELLETAGSGERWRAYIALADALAALPKNRAQAASAQNAVRRALELLSEIREQFAATDIERRTAFTLAHQKPARHLHALLSAAHLFSEATEVSRAWQLNLHS